MSNRKKSPSALLHASDRRVGTTVSARHVRKCARERILAVVGVPLLVIAIGVFAFGDIASAHVVTSITADCYQVTVHFSDFPDTGVIVHITADVNGQTVDRDVLVTSTTSEASVDISAATAALIDTPAHIDVDVTWIFWGPQHVHETLTATCASSTTTTSGTTPTSQGSATTTPAVPVTAVTQPSTTTTGPQTTTSTQVHGATTVAPTTSGPATTTAETVSPQGNAAPATTTTVPAGPVTLPRTGSTTVFPLMFGLSSLIAGALLLRRQRRIAGRTHEDWSSAS